MHLIHSNVVAYYQDGVLRKGMSWDFVLNAVAHAFIPYEPESGSPTILV